MRCLLAAALSQLLIIITPTTTRAILEIFSNKLHTWASSRKMGPEKIAAWHIWHWKRLIKLPTRPTILSCPLAECTYFCWAPSSTSALTFYPTPYNSCTEPTCSPIKVLHNCTRPPPTIRPRLKTLQGARWSSTRKKLNKAKHSLTAYNVSLTCMWQRWIFDHFEEWLVLMTMALPGIVSSYKTSFNIHAKLHTQPTEQTCMLYYFHSTLTDADF